MILVRQGQDQRLAVQRRPGYALNLAGRFLPRHASDGHRPGFQSVCHASVADERGCRAEKRHVGKRHGYENQKISNGFHEKLTPFWKMPRSAFPNLFSSFFHFIILSLCLQYYFYFFRREKTPRKDRPKRAALPGRRVFEKGKGQAPVMIRRAPR